MIDAPSVLPTAKWLTAPIGGRQLQILLLPAHAERNVGALDAALRHLVALVDVARLAIVDDGIGAAILRRQHGGIGEEIVLERLKAGCMRRKRREHHQHSGEQVRSEEFGPRRAARQPLPSPLWRKVARR